ncbi:MAG: dihydrofolate reductase family protein [Bacteriovoracaceae bacterium]
MANKVFIATSVDGFIADKDGSVDWLNENPSPSGSDGGFTNFMETVDALIMGRNTFQTVLGLGIDWPYSKKVFVLSNSLKEIDKSLKDKVEIVSGDIKKIVQNLNDRGFKNLYIDGGQTIQSFLKENLIDELIITRVPIILGGGVPLFGELPHKIRLEHCGTKTLDNGMVQSHFKTKK